MPRPRTADDDACLRQRREAWSSIALFCAAWTFVVVVGRSRLFQDPGTFWHIITGERILGSGLPQRDWLTFTFEGAPWVANQWLAEVAMALLHRWGGLDALLIAAAAVIAAVLTFVFRHLADSGVALPWAAVLTALAFLGSAGHLHVRPHLLSIPLFAVLMARLATVDTGATRASTLLSVVPLFVVWSNVHGAALGGIGTVAVVCGTWLARRAAGASAPLNRRKDIIVVCVLPAACAAAALANPYGLDLPRSWIAIVSSRAISNLVLEHAPVWRASAPELIVLMVLYVAIWLSAGAQRWRAVPLVTLVWLALAAERVRHAPLFVMSAWISMPSLLSQSGAARWFVRRGVLLARAAAPGRRVLAAPMTAAVGIVLLAAGAFHDRGSAPRIARLDPYIWPVELVPELRSLAAIHGDGTPILNDTFYGAFIAYETPAFRVFSDDRCELFGDAFMDHEVRADAAWLQDWIDRKQVTIALARHGSPLERFIRASRAWCNTANSAPAALYVRGANCASAESAQQAARR